MWGLIGPHFILYSTTWCRMAYDYIGIANKILQEFNEVTLDSAAEFNSAIGFQAAVKNFVNHAINDITQEEDNRWEFLATDTTQVLLTDGTFRYSAPAASAFIDFKSFYIGRDVALTNPDATKITEMPYARFRDTIFVRNFNLVTADFGKPDFVIRNNDNDYFIDIPAAEAYTLNFTYFTNPTALSASTDAPIIPERFEYVIVDGALIYANRFRDNIEGEQLATERFTKGINEMRRQLIPITDSVQAPDSITKRYI